MVHCKRGCGRRADRSGLCRHCWDADHGRPSTSYTPRRAGTVRYHGLTLRRATADLVERVATVEGLAVRAVLSGIVEAWAARRLWRPARLASVLACLALWTCALPQPPPAGPVRREALTSTELEQRGSVRRVVPPRPEDWQKRPPCDADAGETEVNGACYVEVARRRAPCGPVLLEHGGACYRAVAKPEPRPSVVGAR